MHKLVGWSIPKRVLGRLANLGILPSYEEVLILLDDANPAYDWESARWVTFNTLLGMFTRNEQANSDWLREYFTTLILSLLAFTLSLMFRNRVSASYWVVRAIYVQMLNFGLAPLIIIPSFTVLTYTVHHRITFLIRKSSSKCSIFSRKRTIANSELAQAFDACWQVIEIFF